MVEARRKLEQHAEERAREEARTAVVRARERREEQRKADMAMQRELLLQSHMKQARARLNRLSVRAVDIYGHWRNVCTHLTSMEQRMQAHLLARARLTRSCSRDIGFSVLESMQAKLLCAQKISHAKSLLKFIRTETGPPILWQPAALNEELEDLYAVRVRWHVNLVVVVTRHTFHAHVGT